MPIPGRRSFQHRPMRTRVLCGISTGFPVLSPIQGQVAYALLTRAPVAANALPHRDAPRLACVKPAASVHPEPGSNSPLFIFKLSAVYLLSLLFSSQTAPSVGSRRLCITLTEGFRPLPLSLIIKRFLIALLQRTFQSHFCGLRVQRYINISSQTKCFCNFFLNKSSFLPQLFENKIIIKC